VDKRKFSRARFETYGSIIVGNQSVQFTVLDISLQGAFIHLDRPDLLDVGDEAQLIFRLSGTGVRISATGELVRKHGMYLGFTFTLIDAESLAHLRRIMEFNLADLDTVEDELSHFTTDEPQ
jgi:hypothetical protein